MKRRNFVQALSAAAAAAAASPLLARGAQAAAPRQSSRAREYYELRQYRLRVNQRGRANQYFGSALVPALNRAGVEPVGVFNIIIGEFRDTYVLIPHRTLETVASLPARLLDDAEYRKAGAAFLEAPAADPPFERVESSLLLAFEKVPRIEAPEKKPRIFELRRYESPSELTSKKKIEMFNAGGELEIFRRVGLRPVFFGETLVGPRLPCFHYMVTFENLAAREETWRKFSGDPEWKKLAAMKEYSDPQIMTNIGAALLGPAPYSQI